MGEEEIYEFAVVITVSPPSGEGAWERALRGARLERGMQMAVRSASLVLFTIWDVQEFLAIDRAQRFLEQIARNAGVRVALNAQPSQEV